MQDAAFDALMPPLTPLAPEDRRQLIADVAPLLA
jgi:hypothetical protein